MRRPSLPVFLAAALAITAGLTGIPHDASAQQRYAELPPGRAYQVCLAEARRNPDTGFEAAIAWRDEGGGPPALHCVALALFELGQFSEAGKRLEDLATGMPGAGNRERAAILGQAGSVWLHANDLSRAHAALTRALELDGEDPELWIDRGDALARSGEYWEAIDDFSAAIDRDPSRLDALVFRAAAYRLLDVTDLARDDIARALAVDPDQPDALVELGAIHAQVQEFGAARTAWLRVLSVAPGSRAADAARSALQQMDVQVDR